MTEKYVVVKTHNFDSESEAVEFDNYERATKYLEWMWQSYYDEEIRCESHLDEGNCYHYEDYGRVQWDDGDYTEFNLIEIYPEREDFPG